MRNLIALTIILLLTASAEASHASRLGPDLTYSCDTVRWASTKFTHEQLLAYAKEYGITHVVLGRPGKKSIRLFNRALHDELIRELPEVDLVII